jgi:cell fate regulator YaaT (PSP1 superfamily)
VVQRNKRDLSSIGNSFNDSNLEENNEAENNGGEITESYGENENNASTFNNDSQRRNKYYFYPKFEQENFVPIKVIDVKMDEANDKVIIYLATDMAKDSYYVVL